MRLADAAMAPLWGHQHSWVDKGLTTNNQQHTEETGKQHRKQEAAEACWRLHAVFEAPAQDRKVRHCLREGMQWKHSRKAVPWGPRTCSTLRRTKGARVARLGAVKNGALF